jgi:hypothetical protein
LEVSGERVTGSSAVGDRDANPKWQMSTNGKKIEDFESFFRAFATRFSNNNGSFKVDGSLVFEFVPKSQVRGEKLISPETSFYFHRMAEGVVYSDNNQDKQNRKNPALDSYNYQKNVAPLIIETLDRYMPPV